MNTVSSVYTILINNNYLFNSKHEAWGILLMKHTVLQYLNYQFLKYSNIIKININTRIAFLVKVVFFVF